MVYLLSAVDVLPNGTRWITGVLGYPLFVAGLVFFLFAVRNGVALAKGRERAIRGALIVQAAHTLWFAFVGGPHVQVGSGPWVGLKVSSVQLQLSAGFSSSFFVGTRVAGPRWEFGLNFLALVWTALLFKA